MYLLYATAVDAVDVAVDKTDYSECINFFLRS